MTGNPQTNGYLKAALIIFVLAACVSIVNSTLEMVLKLVGVCS